MSASPLLADAPVVALSPHGSAARRRAAGSAHARQRPLRAEPLPAEPLPARLETLPERPEADDPATPAPWADEVPTALTLLRHDGTVLPTPPCPPFAATAEGWTAVVPGRLGRKLAVTVTAEGIAFGTAFAAWDDVVHATVSLGTSDDQGVVVGYDLRIRGGGAVRARTGSLSRRHADALYDVADHVWELLRVAVSPRLRAPVAAAVALGQTVEVAGLLLHRDGVAAARKPDQVVPWRVLGDPTVDRRAVVVPAGVKVLRTPIASRDAVLLLDLLPELRTAKLHGDLG